MLIYSRPLPDPRKTGKIVGVDQGVVDLAYMSQICSECGFQNKGNRNSAVFKCLDCGYHDHADFNASRNTKNRYIEELPHLPKKKGAKIPNLKVP